MTEQAVTPTREKRLSFTNIAPKAANGWTGTVTATIAESNEQVAFYFTTPELSERDARAITAGYVARLSIAASGKKTADEIAKALNDEVLVLTSGTYTIRGGSSAQSSFNDTIVSLALHRKFPGIENSKFSEEQYQDVLADLVLLADIQANWDDADEAGKKALVTGVVAKTKRLVGFFKM